MHLFVLLLLVAVLAYDQAGLDPLLPMHGPMLWVVSIVPFALALIGVFNACRHTARVLDYAPENASKSLKRLEKFLAVNRGVILAAFLCTLYLFGTLAALRESLGDLIVINELIALGPALLTLVAFWWAYYPVDRRLREVALMRQLDTGGTVWPIWSRRQYVWSQFRSQVLLLLAPMMVLLGWTQLVAMYTQELPAESLMDETLVIAGGLGIFLLAPVLIRNLWDTAPLPDGPLRRRLMGMCRSYGVGVRQLLLWRTYGGLINGAVMGLFGRLRYILLTDGLIERLSEDHVEAVMAHELGHVKRHHMPWLAVCAIVPLMAGSMMLDGLMAGLEQLKGEPLWNVELARAVGTAALLAGWVMIFGFISRRFERQADTFALQHMSRKLEDPQNPGMVSAEAARIVAGALERIAALNHHPADRRSWRHGSISWRVDYLYSLVGTPIDRCPIDLQMARIRWAALTAIALMTVVDLTFKM